MIITAGSDCPASGADRLFRELGSEKKTFKSVSSDGHDFYVITGGDIITKSLIKTIENRSDILALSSLLSIFAFALF